MSDAMVKTVAEGVLEMFGGGRVRGNFDAIHREAICRGAKVEYGEYLYDDDGIARYVRVWLSIDHIRYVFPDASAIVWHWSEWDVEGEYPFYWR